MIRRVNAVEPRSVEEFEREVSETLGRRAGAMEIAVDRQGDVEVLRISLR